MTIEQIGRCDKVDKRFRGGIGLGQDIVSICIADDLGQIVLDRNFKAGPIPVFDHFNRSR